MGCIEKEFVQSFTVAKVHSFINHSEVKVKPGIKFKNFILKRSVGKATRGWPKIWAVGSEWQPL